MTLSEISNLNGSEIETKNSQPKPHYTYKTKSESGDFNIQADLMFIEAASAFNEIGNAIVLTFARSTVSQNDNQTYGWAMSSGYVENEILLKTKTELPRAVSEDICRYAAKICEEQSVQSLKIIIEGKSVKISKTAENDKIAEMLSNQIGQQQNEKKSQVKQYEALTEMTREAKVLGLQ